jgi:Dolichyl-phosphate-mannose-protein mannosyltransferase
MWNSNRSGVVALCLMLGVAVWLVAGDIRVPVPTRYDYDEGVYAATADAVAHGGRLYRDVFLSQPPLFVLTLRAMFGLGGASLAVARSTVVVFSTVWLIAILAILWARGSPGGGLLAVCLVLGRATFLDAARTVEMEVPSEALACAAVGLAAWGVRRPGHLWWAGAGILAALAMMTKLTAVTALIPLIGAAVSDPGPASRGRWPMLVAGSLLAFAVLLPVVGAPGFVDQVFTFHVALARRLGEPLAANAAAIGGFLVREWPLGLVALLGGYRAMASGTAFERALVGWLAVDIVMLAALTPLWAHHLILLVSPLGLLAGSVLRGQRRSDPNLTRAAARRSGSPGWPSAPVLGPRRGARLVTLVILGACVLAYLGVGMSAAGRPAPSTQLERVVDRISRAVPPHGKVLTDDPMVAFLARRGVVDGLIDSSLTRIWAGQISEDHLIATLGASGTDAVVLWRGTFQQYFPRLAPAAASVFPVTETVSRGRVLFLKR